MKLPKGPKISMPSLPKRGGDTAKPVKASARRMNVQPPAFASDLYRDLRDRRLLIPAALLVVALLAVPLMLRSSEEPPPPATAAPVGDATAVEPAVLAEDLSGVRDYRKRLDALKQKNPFKQQYLVPEDTAESVESVGGVEEVGGGSSVGGGSTAPVSSGSTDPVAGGSGSVEPAAPSSNTKIVKETKVLIFSPRIDLTITHEGERKKLENVRPGQLLPGRNSPVLVFLRANATNGSARFAVSADATSVEGDGACKPDAGSCRLLRLDDGEKHVFTYGTEAERYAFKVTKVHRQLIAERNGD